MKRKLSYLIVVTMLANLLGANVVMAGTVSGNGISLENTSDSKPEDVEEIVPDSAMTDKEENTGQDLIPSEWENADEKESEPDSPAVDATVNLQGEGTQQNPYLIQSVQDLQVALQNDVYVAIDDCHYKLMEDLDISDRKLIYTNKTLAGVFDGNGHTITLCGFYNASGQEKDYAGLFYENQGTIKNLKLIFPENSWCCMPVCQSNKGTIENCDITFKKGRSDDWLRIYNTTPGYDLPWIGISYQNSGVMRGCAVHFIEFETMESMAACTNINTGTIEQCLIDGVLRTKSLQGKSNWSSSNTVLIYGVANKNLGTIKGVNCALQVTNEDLANVQFCGISMANGDFDRVQKGSIEDCVYTGDVTDITEIYGIAFRSCGNISRCLVKGNFTASSKSSDNRMVKVSGVVNSSDKGLVEDCSYTGDISIEKASQWYAPEVAGICCSNGEGVIKNCFYTGQIRVNAVDSQWSSLCIGGLVGSNRGTITACGADARITSNSMKQGMTLGGIASGNTGLIEKSFWRGEICDTSTFEWTDELGGIAGINTGDIRLCMAQGSIVKENNHLDTTKSTFRFGDVIGGIAGRTEMLHNQPSTITDCMANVSIVNQNESAMTVGGVAGVNMYHDKKDCGTDIVNCYAYGQLPGNCVGLGGITGYASDYKNKSTKKTLEQNCFFVSVYPQRTVDSVAGGTGKTLVQLQQKNTYKGWDFETVWAIEAGKNKGLPYLRCMADKVSVDTYSKVSISSGKNGKVLPSGSFDLYDGDSCELLFQPNKGYMVKEVVVNGKKIGGVTSYVLKDNGKKQTVKVTFEKIQSKTIRCNNGVYVVTTKGKKEPTVAFTGIVSDAKKSVTIPNVIKQGKTTYKVTEISENALKDHKKIKKVVIGKNVSRIGTSAFAGCSSLTTIQIKSNELEQVGSNALKGVHKKLKIKVPKFCVSKYVRLFSDKGMKSVKVTK